MAKHLHMLLYDIMFISFVEFKNLGSRHLYELKTLINSTILYKIIFNKLCFIAISF